jgi:Ankyrin repeats (many copies)
MLHLFSNLLIEFLVKKLVIALIYSTLSTAYYHYDTVHYLVSELRADINMPSSANRTTALHKAAVCGMLQLTQLLLHHGADVNALSNSGWIPMHNAVMSYCQCPLYSSSSTSSLMTSSSSAGAAAAGSSGEAQQQQQQQAEPKQREHLAVIQLLAQAFVIKNPDVELLPPAQPGQHFDVDMQALLRVAMQQARALVAPTAAAAAAIGNGFTGSGSSSTATAQQQQLQSNGLQKVELLQRAHEEMQTDSSNGMVDIRAV